MTVGFAKVSLMGEEIKGEGEQDKDNTNHIPSPLMETFAKLTGTAITYADHRISQVAFSYRFPPTRE